jgi:hypothetical protein
MGLPSYNGKPAPIHSGDFDAVGFSTVELTSSGFAALAGGQYGSSGQGASASKPIAGTIPSLGGLASPVVAFGLLAAAVYYLDRRIAR